MSAQKVRVRSALARSDENWNDRSPPAHPEDRLLNIHPARKHAAAASITIIARSATARTNRGLDASCGEGATSRLVAVEFSPVMAFPERGAAFGEVGRGSVKASKLGKYRPFGIVTRIGSRMPSPS